MVIKKIEIHEFTCDACGFKWVSHTRINLYNLDYIPKFCANSLCSTKFWNGKMITKYPQTTNLILSPQAMVKLQKQNKRCKIKR